MSTPSKIGPFEVIRELGQGGMGAVYEVREPTTDRRLALKVIREGVADALSLERFHREAELLARVHHRSVVRVHKTGRVREGPYLLQEVVQGETLRALVARGPLDPRRAAELARELADALQAIHATGVLHRDLKPVNVIVQPDGIPVLLDFGVARDTTAERLTRTGAIVGTVVYMSPEQADGRRSLELDGRVDVYGLGAVLYELLTGRPPFDGSPTQVLLDVLRVDPPTPLSLRPDLPPALDAIVRVAMSKEPTDRYPTAAALRDDLDRFLAEGKAAARPVRSTRGPRRVALAAGGVGLAFALGLGAAIVATRPDPPPTPTTPAPRPTPPPATEPPPAPVAPVWSLTAGEAFGLTLKYSETDAGLAFESTGELRARVRAATPERLDLDLTFEALQLGLGSPALGVGPPFDSRTPTEHPFRPMEKAVGGTFACALDPRTGAVVEVRGLADVLAKVDLEAVRVRNIPDVDRNDAREAVKLLFSDASFTVLLGSLLQARGPGALDWSATGQLAKSQRQRLLPSLLPLGRRAPPGKVVVEGQTAYAADRYREGHLVQTPAQGEGQARLTLTLGP